MTHGNSGRCWNVQTRLGSQRNFPDATKLVEFEKKKKKKGKEKGGGYGFDEENKQSLATPPPEDEVAAAEELLRELWWVPRPAPLCLILNADGFTNEHPYIRTENANCRLCRV